MDEKAPGKGTGAYANKGAERSQAEAISALQNTDADTAAVLAEMDARITALEGGTGDTGTEPTA